MSFGSIKMLALSMLTALQGVPDGEFTARLSAIAVKTPVWLLSFCRPAISRHLKISLFHHYSHSHSHIVFHHSFFVRIIL